MSCTEWGGHMKQISLVDMLCESPKSIASMANLDPTDPRTRCYKRAVATHVSVEAACGRIAELGTLTGNDQLDWDTPYCGRLGKRREDRVTKIVNQSIESGGSDPIFAVTHAVRHFVCKDVATMSTDESNEYIRKIVNGIVNQTRS